MDRPTIIDVARRAGVSRQTVSRAMNDQPGISAATREKVLAVAQELRYRPSRFGRGLVEKGPVTVGLVLSDLSNAYFADLGAAVVRACAPRGWSVVMVEADQSPHPERVASELARRVDALVGYGLVDGDISGGTGMPVVQLDDSGRAPERYALVRLDIAGAAEGLAAHLRAVGVRRPAVVDLDGPDMSPRAQAFSAALASLHSEGEVPVHAAPLRGDHNALISTLLADGTDAIIAFNDDLGVHLLRSLRLRDVPVPHSMRLVGMDGLEVGSLVSPELTTLAVDREEVARQCVELVAGMLEGTIPLTGPAAIRTVPYTLQVRESA